MRTYCKVKFMEDQYKKSLTAGRLFFVDETCAVRAARQRCVVAEHKTSHVCLTDWRLGLSVPLQLYEEVHNFVGRKFGQRTLYAAFRRSSSPRPADPCPLLLSLSLSFSLSLASFFVYPLHANVHRLRGCAHQTFLLISWSRTRGTNFPFSGRGRKRKRRPK